MKEALESLKSFLNKGSVLFSNIYDIQFCEPSKQF